MSDTLDARITEYAATLKNYRVAQALLLAFGVATRAMAKQSEFEDLVRALLLALGVATQAMAKQSEFQDLVGALGVDLYAAPNTDPIPVNRRQELMT